ncbi:unnamed protein product [Blepharisma stoltei]|uniref:Zinc finger PHD-type domain-containing protein n=1 Tax=Blepharisma stoltei TaxID=1481888 RepID=A0AAU9J1E7_9CILI|nr:unnamed protein product [Blepharisma stoltei]
MATGNPGKNVSKTLSSHSKPSPTFPSTNNCCHVCWSKESSSSIKPELSIPLHSCRTCNLTVHRACYGLTSSNETFYCDRCMEVGPTITLSCRVCHQTNGALKKCGRFWVHVTCALFTDCFRIADWQRMRIVEQNSEIPETYCEECKELSIGTIKCTECDKRAHLICMLQRNKWNPKILLRGAGEILCEEHKIGQEIHCFCGKRYLEGTKYMIRCDICCTLYHGDCVGIPETLGKTIEDYICKFCDQWSKVKKKLVKEIVTGTKVTIKMPNCLVNLNLGDWLLIANLAYKRALEFSEGKLSNENFDEIIEMTKNLPFYIQEIADLKEKSNKIRFLTSKLKDFNFGIERELTDEEAIQVKGIIDESKSIGLNIPDFNNLAVKLRKYENLKKIKTMVQSSHEFTLSSAKALYDEMLNIMPNHNLVHQLHLLIEECNDWFNTIRESLAKSQTSSLEDKLTVLDVNCCLDKAKQLPFQLPAEIKIIKEELSAAEAWDKKFSHLEMPYNAQELQRLIEDMSLLTIQTPYMLKAKEVWTLFSDWNSKTESYTNGSENKAPPSYEEIKQHIRYGETQIDSKINVKEITTQLLIKVNEACIWQTNAQAAIVTKVTPQRLNHLLREGKSIICHFPEYDVLEKRAGINKKISEILHKKHKEEDLVILLQDAEKYGADDEFIVAVQNKLQCAQELKAKVKETLEGSFTDPNSEYSKVLDEIKNARTDLLEEKQMLEDKIKSLKWMEQTREALNELESQDSSNKRKKTSEIEVLRNIVNRGIKIGCIDPQAEKMLEDLAFRLWELEFQRFEMCDEITVEQLQDLSQKAKLLKNYHPQSLAIFNGIMEEVEEALKYFDSLSEQDVSAIISESMTELQRNINLYKDRLEKHGIIIPEKYNKLLLWDKWIDWCLSTDKIFKGNSKPSIDRLYEANQEAISMGIPNDVPALKMLTEEIFAYEQWLYKYTFYFSARKLFSSQSLNIQHYLKNLRDKPKPNSQQLKELLQLAKNLRTCCKEEVSIMESDLTKLEKWLGEERHFFEKHPYENLLAACKKKYDEFRKTAAFEEFYKIVKEYCFEVYIETDDYGKKLCSYEWNFSGQRILQQKGKIPQEEWDDLFASIEYLNKEYLDAFTLDRLRRQQSLRIQIEEDVEKIKSFDPAAEIKPINLEELELLYEQVVNCKISISQEAYVKDLIEQCKNFDEKFKSMIQNKVFVQEFKELQNDLMKIPVSMPEISSQLKSIIEKTATLATRMKILKEYSGKNKIERTKVEQFLNDYKHADARIEDAEDIIAELDYGKQILSEAASILDSQNVTLDQLNSISGRLTSLKIHMGQDEKVIRVKIWKLKVKLAQIHKVNFSILVGWFNEGKQMKEPSLFADLDKLENLINKGEKFKERLSCCRTLEEIIEIENETEKLPFDLAHSIIEHKTRINLSGGGKADNAEGDLIPSKRPNEEVQDIEFVRKNNVKEILQKIMSDINFVWDNKEEKMNRIATKIEEIAFRAYSQEGRYKKAIENILRIIRRLQNYEGFSLKLLEGEIKPDQLTYIEPKELKEPKVIKRIFDGVPLVTLTISKDKLNQPDRSKPVKKQKIEQTASPVQQNSPITRIEPIIPTQSGSSKAKIQSLIKEAKSHQKKEKVLSVPLKEAKPKISPQIPEPLPIQKPKPSEFSVSNLIHEVEAYKKKYDTLEPKQESHKEFIEKAKNSNVPPDSSAMATESIPNEEWKEHNKSKAELNGSTKPNSHEIVPKKRVPEDFEEEYITKRSKYEEIYQEGKFSSDEELVGEPQPADPNLSRPLYDEDVYGTNQQEEYNVFDFAQKVDYSAKRKIKKKNKLFDPYSSNAVKNKAPAGSLLKVWTGKLEYGKHFINVNMNSVDTIDSFQKMPQFGNKISIQGRTKQDELEIYVSQNSSGPVTKAITTAWIEPAEGSEKEFGELVRDLTDKGRAAVIRIDSSLTMYLSSLNESFKAFLASIHININQKLSPAVVPFVSTKEKIGCILFFKKSAASSGALMLNPEVIAQTDPNSVPEVDDLPEKEQEMSPITSEEENQDLQVSENIPKALQDAISAISAGSGSNPQILNNLQDAISNIRENGSEITELISIIRQQVEQESKKQQTPGVQNVNQFLSQQYVPRPTSYVYPPQNYMYAQQPPYGNQYYPRQNQPYKPPSPQKKHDDPRRHNRY